MTRGKQSVTLFLWWNMILRRPYLIQLFNTLIGGFI